jgi:hypothetical protein
MAHTVIERRRIAAIEDKTGRFRFGAAGVTYDFKSCP